MKAHTNNFKEQIKLIGKEIDSKITFGDTVLGKSELNAVTPSFQSSILKSAMKQLDIDSNVYIPVGSVLKYEFGLKVNGEYEYINFGNYIVKDIEKQEDTNSYKITCYDKMLLSMKDYAKMPITYPITIRDYINSMCNFLGLSFANRNNTFVNYNKEIPYELYLDSEGNSLGYTFRDVFDELAQVTASTICINDNDEVEIRYINDTGDTIDEEYLKDVNVNFGEKYGKVNSIVLSRSGQSDNIYLRDETSIEENGLAELKIIDNQIMNFNNRDEFLPEIFGKLNGLEYYLNDFSSTGITYYDICDRYNVRVGDATYSCVMFNDEILVTQGLQENVFTEMPEETETDYTKADKTDRKINQTYIIVDKQNQQIESVVSQTDAQNEKIAKVTQTVEELNSKISDIAEITISKETNTGNLEFESINQSEPIRIVIRPIGEHISYLYPNSNMWPTNEYKSATEGLVPSETLTPSNSLVPSTKRNAQNIIYLKDRKLRFHNKTTDENFDITLPGDLLYYDNENYDEFILDYAGLSCMINKKVGYNANGSVHLLENPSTIEYDYIHTDLTDGDYEVSLLGYDNAYLFVRLMAQNIYTTQFATRAELNSEISQTANTITTDIDAKFENYSTTTEMNNTIIQSITNSENSIKSEISKTYATKEETTELSNTIEQEINDTENKINIEVNKKLNSEDFTGANILLEINNDKSSATINANKINMNGESIDLNATDFSLVSDLYNNNSYSQSDLNRIQSIILGTISATQADYDKYDITGSGTIDSQDYVFISKWVNGISQQPTSQHPYKFKIGASEKMQPITILDNYGNVVTKIGGMATLLKDLVVTSGSNLAVAYAKSLTIVDEEGNFISQLFSDGSIWCKSLDVTGSKNRLVTIDNGVQVRLGAYETATPYFGDIGSNKTDENGYCRIEIEDIFSQTIETDDYKVFIQECGEGHLYIEKHNMYFEVKGTPNLDFDWELKAIQKGFKDIRLQEKESEK